jgi:hypothetical protein
MKAKTREPERTTTNDEMQMKKRQICLPERLCLPFADDYDDEN